MIVGLSGKKQSGKDTIAAYLVKEHGFERKAFADPLKRSMAALLDIPFSHIDKLKNDPNMYLAIVDMDAKMNITPMYYPITFRRALQRYGTEAHRDEIGIDFWVDLTLPLNGYYPGRAIVVTDVRYRNEAQRVKQLGGTNWMVHRKAALDSQDQHRSELFDFDDLIDSNIYNDGTVEDLFDAVEVLLSSVKEHAT